MHCMQLLFNLEIVFEKEIELLHIAMFFKIIQNEDNIICFQKRKKEQEYYKLL